MTQGQKLIAALKVRDMTYAEMIRASGSLSPQKRVKEALRFLPSLKVRKGKRRVGRRELVTWRVVRAKA